MGRIVGPQGKPVLDRRTIDYMYKNLLSARGKLGDADYSVIAGCAEPAGDDLGSPEQWADQEKFIDELLSALGDLSRWVTEFWAVSLTADALSAGVTLSVLPLLVVTTPGLLVTANELVRIPETENHQLMIESSRYLTNNAMI